MCAVSTRQRELFAGEDWTVLYRAFSQINFNASDPPSINAALRAYVQANYPEDFNDWIEQSEFVAIIDLLSWLAGNLAFKTDMAVRENFIEVAEARDSILRLARFLSYNASRCLPATGVLKLTAISTDDDVYDSFGTNLNNLLVLWNNPDDPNWYERFIAILNNAFISTNPFGIPLKQGTVQTVATQLYRINGLVNGNQLGFTATVAGETMDFELCNGDFTDGGVLSERPPNPGAALHIFNLNDSNGNASPRTGFFVLFKQGTSGTQTFAINQPVANQLIDLTPNNINQNDVWVQTVDDNGTVLTDWIEVPIVLNNNITYNTLPASQRSIFSVITRDSDQITLRFSDGLYGNAPVGNLRVTYRISNGLSYTMKPLDINQTQVPFFYVNPQGVQKALYLNFALQEQVSNAGTAETIENIRARAPEVYATQNRMVSGEDYNTFPLQTNLALRIKAVNRVYSGQSRYIDLNDPTGTYQDLSIFDDDGILFAEPANAYTEVPTALNYTPADMISLFIQPMIGSAEMANLVRDCYVRALGAQPGGANGSILTPSDLYWNQSTALLYNTTGWFTVPSPAQSWATSLILPGAQIKFRLADNSVVWTSVIAVQALPYTPAATNTNGAVTLSDVIPTGAMVVAVLPRFVAALTSACLIDCINRIGKKLSFSLSYDYLTGLWSAGAPAPLDAIRLTGSTLRLLSVDYMPGGGTLSGVWRVVGGGLSYVFESIAHIAWYDNGARAIDQSTGAEIADQIAILKINPDLNNEGVALKIPYTLAIEQIWCYPDGTAEPRRTRVLLQDTHGYGYPDNPDTFYKVIDTTQPPGANTTLFWYTDGTNVAAYPYDYANITVSGLLVGYDNYDLMMADTSRDPGTEAFITSGGSQTTLVDATFWTYTATITGNTTQNVWTQDFGATPSRPVWSFAIGRGPNVAGIWRSASGTITRTDVPTPLFFHWRHTARADQRIDPSITNMHDIFVLTTAYDAAMRLWVKNGAIPALLPQPPTELDLRLAFASMEDFRMFSDGIVWRPVRYKLLFGNGADPAQQANFKVVRLPNATLADGEIKSNIIATINAYFAVSGWDFGETFFYTELAAYIHQQLAGQIASIVLVPQNAAGRFGNDFEISCDPDQIFISTASVANVQIITSNTPANLRIR